MDNKKFFKKRSGLTMSEALFTLSIIGVIAGLTIFGLLAKLSDTKNIAALKKFYTSVSQVTMFVMLDRSSPNYWGLDEYSQQSSATAYSYFRPYFKVIRECSNETGCWQYPTKFLSGKVYLKNVKMYQSRSNTYTRRKIDKITKTSYGYYFRIPLGGGHYYGYRLYSNNNKV